MSGLRTQPPAPGALGPPASASLLRWAKRSHRVASVVIVLLLVASPVFADRWYEHYDRAEEALDKGRWSQAVAELNDALERKGDSGARERSYGMKVIAYFPYFKLGIAYFHLGQLDAALEAFDTEERLGAIQASPPALAELERYRRMVRDAREQLQESEQGRIDDFIARGLAEARTHEDAGRFTEAVAALDRVLAVAPGDAAAATAMERVRGELASREREREGATRALRLIADGRVALERSQYAVAARLFHQALTASPSAEAQRLLDQAQEGLRAAGPPASPAAGSFRRDDDLVRVRELEAEGRIADALEMLQPILAVGPDDDEATALLNRLLSAQDERERRVSVAAALVEGEAAYSSTRYEDALAAANRALALDAGNQDALGLVRRAYREVSRRLLGGRDGENIPPAIRFADLREARDDGSRVQLVRDEDFQLNGVVIDSSPVEVSFADGGGGVLAGSASSQSVGEYVITEFNVRRRLAPGPSTIKVVATDDSGLSTTAEYVVVYARPLLRSGWFMVLLALVPIALGSGLWAHREQRRRRLRRRRHNPYVAGAPVLDDALFVGRDKLIDRILQTVHNNSLLLFGERRIGKTSLQHHIKRRLQQLDDPEYVFFPVLVDLQGTSEDRFFATVMEDIVQELGPVIGDFSPGPLAAGTLDYGYREFVADLRHVLAVLEAGTDRRVKLVLLIDEVDELNAYDPRINQRLRSLFMKSFADTLVAVVSGVEIVKHWEKEGSPWYNFFEEIEVVPISRADARGLIVRPMKGILEIEDAAVDRVIELSACKPYLIQRMCMTLVNRAHETGRRTIRLGDVDAIERADGS